MKIKVKTKETRMSGFDERMKRELVAHDYWVADCEKQRRTKVEQTVKTPKTPK